jgi:Cu/Ag efflux pump CusA
MAHGGQVRMQSPLHKMHVELPFQFLLGLIFMSVGSLLILKKIGRNYVPFIPEEILIWICAVGAAVGGFYLLLTKLWRHRIWL